MKKTLHTLLALCLVAASTLQAQYTKLFDFAGPGTFTGANPHVDQNLLSVDGVMYGMTERGGTNNLGTIFKINPDGTGYTKLLDFAGATNGSYTYSSLIFDGTSLYGMTGWGGTNNLGTIFKINLDGTGYTKLLDFAGASNGSQPYGSLIFDGTSLYGMTRLGGTNNLGTIFKINPDGTGYTKLLDFAGATNGSNPYSSLISVGTSLYGMTQNGGTNHMGTIFKINPDGTGYTKLLDFAGASNGSRPVSSLIFDGTSLYGMTRSGGNLLSEGTIFKINPDGTGYTKLLNFAGATTGSNPHGSLISDGTSLYGMTYAGGTNNLGTIFKINPDGTDYTKLLDFAGESNGSNPLGSLISDGASLYGMTTAGGTSDLGTLFKINPDGTGYTKLLGFARAINGSNPYGSLISDGTSLYGMTRVGGPNTRGTIFKINPDGTGYTKLLNFVGGTTTGSNPHGSLISDGTSLYGMTYFAGTNDRGTVFKINPDGTDYTKLLDFAGATNGSSPLGSLISDGTSLYGMTYYGGTNNLGTLFKINPDGTDYTKLLDFAGATNGSYPWGSLIFDGTSLYGMTQNGGTNNLGTLFKINPDGTGYTKLLDFAGTSNGSNPLGDLISDGTSLYGMTQNGGTNGMGTIFKINPDGTGYTKLVDFVGASNGSNPWGSLISAGNFLYGMTTAGGTNNLGTLFKINPDGTGYTKLVDFAGESNGSSPLGNLISDGTSLYGMTTTGGTNDLGTIFKYDICPIADAPGNVNACDSYTLPALTVGNYYTATNGGGTPLSAGASITSAQTLYVYAVNGTCTDENSFEVTINNSPANTVTVSGNTLTADETGATYQWLDCDNSNAAISGATAQSYEPVVSGNFAVEITKNGCTSTSACQSLTFVGLNELTQINFSAYPNPTSGELTIQLGDFVYSEVTVVVRNSIGQETMRKNYASSNKLDLIIEGEIGIYLVEIKTGDKSAVLKVIKN